MDDSDEEIEHAENFQKQDWQTNLKANQRNDAEEGSFSFTFSFPFFMTFSSKMLVKDHQECIRSFGSAKEELRKKVLRSYRLFKLQQEQTRREPRVCSLSIPYFGKKNYGVKPTQFILK